jgi:hypothetical protein
MRGVQLVAFLLQGLGVRLSRGLGSRPGSNASARLCGDQARLYISNPSLVLVSLVSRCLYILLTRCNLFSMLLDATMAFASTSFNVWLSCWMEAVPNATSTSISAMI